jgi:hypothetical protein
MHDTNKPYRFSGIFCERICAGGEAILVSTGLSVWLQEREKLIEGGQFDQVVVGNSFHGLSGLAPGAETTSDYVHFESKVL